MEFDSQGRIILPGRILEDKERDNDSIILEKVQVNAKNPAIAQLKIQLGQNLKTRFNEEAMIKEIYYFCKQFMDRSYRYNDVQSSINLFGSSVVIETKSSFQMYSFLDAIIEEMRELYVNNKGIKVSLRGSYGF
jgi:hypothetical protein